MKRFILVLTVFFGLSAVLNAQTCVNSSIYNDAGIYGIPGAFTNNGHSNIVCKGGASDNYCCIYDNDFSTVLLTLDEDCFSDVITSIIIDLSTCGSKNPSTNDDQCLLFFTQSLFNTDDDYEYLGANEGELCVKSTNGTILRTIPCEEGFSWEFSHALLFKIDNNYYFGFAANDNNNGGRKLLIYRIDQTTGLTKVNTQLPISVFPTMPTREQQITVELGEGNNAKEITVVNSLGQVVKRVPVQEGQREVIIPVSEFGSGLNMVNTRTEQGQGSCKIIVR